jgi:hypothetical protein
MQTIYLEPNQVPPALRGGYDGKKFAARVAESVSVPSDAGLWSGGSRDVYTLIELASGVRHPMPGQSASPFDSARQERTVTLKPGFAVVRHSTFCGKDMGLTFFIHPDNAATLLPAPAADLSPVEKLILKYTKECKASHNGQDRYDMAAADMRYGSRGVKETGVETMPTRDEWDAAKALLISGGYLNKAGAITVKGKNHA